MVGWYELAITVAQNVGKSRNTLGASNMIVMAILFGLAISLFFFAYRNELKSTAKSLEEDEEDEEDEDG